MMRTMAAPIQRCACGKSHEAERPRQPGTVQRSALPGAARGFDEGRVHPGVLRPPSGGAPLPGAVQAKMEAAFGHDFGNVRIHHGGEAESIGAVAYTRGSHLHFAPGRYQPHSAEGQRLLGHELAHVVQQRAGRVARPGGAVPINADPALEREADAAGARAAAAQPAALQGGGQQGGAAAGGPAIQPMFRRGLGTVFSRAPSLGETAKRGYRIGLPEETPLITGYTPGHGTDQTDRRDGGIGVDPGAQYDAVHTPKKVIDQIDSRTGRPKKRYEGANATVVLNHEGKVITSWARNKKGWKKSK